MVVGKREYPLEWVGLTLAHKGGCADFYEK